MSVLSRSLTGAVFLVLFAACSSSDDGKDKAGDGGSGDGAPDGAPMLGQDAYVTPDSAIVGECGGFRKDDTACAQCLKTNCCDLGIKCAEKPDCVHSAECIRACQTATDQTACKQACANQYFATAGADYNPLQQCMGNSCATECPFLGP